MVARFFAFEVNQAREINFSQNFFIERVFDALIAWMYNQNNSLDVRFDAFLNGEIQSEVGRRLRQDYLDKRFFSNTDLKVERGRVLGRGHLKFCLDLKNTLLKQWIIVSENEMDCHFTQTSYDQNEATTQAQMAWLRRTQKNVKRD